MANRNWEPAGGTRVPEHYEPFRGVRRVDALLLVGSRPPGSAVDVLDAPYYAEIRARVNIRCAEHDLLAPRGADGCGGPRRTPDTYVPGTTAPYTRSIVFGAGGGLGLAPGKNNVVT